MKNAATTIFLRTSLSLAVIAVTSQSHSGEIRAELSTPPGITLQPLGEAQGVDFGKVTTARMPRDEVAFTNDKGLTLYTYDREKNGAVFCGDECTKAFVPALASADVKTFGDWSLVRRPDGSSQYAFKGKPLYTYIEDVDPGSVRGDSPLKKGFLRRNGRGEIVGQGGAIPGQNGLEAIPTVQKEPKPFPAEWQPAMLYPSQDHKLPAGFFAFEVLDAAALGIIDHKGQTLYVFDGNVKEDPIDPNKWRPLPASQLAIATGHFTIVERGDGLRQWAFKGQPLFTYTLDLEKGDAFGRNVDPRMSLAAIVKHYLPEAATIKETKSQGMVLATASGMTLYKRDGYAHQSGGGYNYRRGAPTRPQVGRDIGINARCDATCQTVWHPFLAPADAKPQGYWNVIQRPDGTKQWTYQDFALWTYSGDNRPADINGHDRYDFELAHDSGTVVDVGTPMEATAALYWGIMSP